MRLAAWLSFLAVLSALVAPVSMLAQDVRAGKLAGICSVNTAPSSNANAGEAGNGDAPQASVHCDLCASTALGLPPLPVVAIPCFAGDPLAVVDLPAAVSAAVPGLPFSRGPPVLL